MTDTTPIRICQVVGNMNGGGVEAVVMNYFRNIDREKVQFDFVATDSSTCIPREEIESLGGRVLTVPHYKNLWSFSRTLSTMFENHPEWKIVHSHMNSLSVFPLRAAKQAGVPVRIAHSHSTSGEGEVLKNTIKTLLKTQSTKYPTHLFACGDYAGKWLFGDNADFEVIPNAIDLSRFSYNPEIRTEVRNALDISDSSYVIGHVGRFMNQKNHAFLIKVFEGVSKVIDNALLVLIGSGEKLGEIKELVKSKGLEEKVRFLGQRADVQELYQAFDLFLLPSLYEGLPLVCVEAQVSGLPSLLSADITQEVQLTDQCKFIPIDSIEPWVKSVLEIHAESNLPREIKNIDAFSTYDIKSQSAKLVDRYISLYEGSANEIQPEILS